MLHVDGVKGARLGPTGSEARDQPIPVPRTWTLGRLSPSRPGRSLAAGDPLASQGAEDMGHICRSSRVMGPGRAREEGGPSSLPFFLSPQVASQDRASSPSGSSQGEEQPPMSSCSPGLPAKLVRGQDRPFPSTGEQSWYIGHTQEPIKTQGVRGVRPRQVGGRSVVLAHMLPEAGIELTYHRVPILEMGGHPITQGSGVTP